MNIFPFSIHSIPIVVTPFGASRRQAFATAVLSPVFIQSNAGHDCRAGEGA